MLHDEAKCISGINVSFHALLLNTDSIRAYYRTGIAILALMWRHYKINISI